jgi:hypothetical protein
VDDGHWYLTGLDLDDVLEGVQVEPMRAEPEAQVVTLPALTGRDRERAARDVMRRAA